MNVVLLALGGAVAAAGAVGAAIRLGRVRVGTKWALPAKLRVAGDVPIPIALMASDCWDLLQAEGAFVVRGFEHRGGSAAMLGEVVVRLPTKAIDLDREAGHVEVVTHGGLATRAEIDAPLDIEARTMLHELGEALGLEHVRRRGHALHPVRKYGGMSLGGVRAAFGRAYRSS